MRSDLDVSRGLVCGRSRRLPDDPLQGRTCIVGDTCTIADFSAWAWLDRASRVFKGTEDPLSSYPDVRRLFQTVEFKKINDEETKRALFPSDHPSAA